jgi:3-deoxy-D-manno-octulosonic-acid transferase
MAGLNNATISGDTRFDRVNDILKKQSEIKLVEDFKGSQKLIVLGSTWKPDVDLWTGFINQNPNLKFVIAPHNIDSQHLHYIEKKLNVSSTRYSQAGIESGSSSLLIIDNIGLLSTIYKYADIAYVGGAFSEGLHNILEPATFGKPVIIGRSKTNKKYQEVQALIQEGGVFEVGQADELEKILDHLLSDDSYYRKVCEASRAYVSKNLGSTAIILEHLKNVLS